MANPGKINVLKNVGVGSLSCLCLSNLVTYAVFQSEGAIILGKAMITSSIVALVLSAPLFAFVFRKMRDLRELNREATRRSHEDQLTGLMNRAAFTEIFAKRCATGVQGPALRMLLLIDIDGFKAINDRLGHPAGDEALCHLANILRDVTGDYGVVARMGGEEFAILLQSSNPSSFLAFAERIRLGVARSPAELDDGAEVDLTVSLGGAFFDSEHAFAEIYKSADELLYKAKNAGRNRAFIAAHQPAAPAPRGGVNLAKAA
ncbi:diguanylate cyclase (GGDEF) domain-containing protein [Fulvimarina manganoxydans]|uniref:diguanylate cyclase n=1 Tax=Fulvimarina manganoxydans TaxID=937218 RepID=A0A1W1YES0_9HYPH|nr:GGDEF domain-containing protein [Fulvimarina manganoxydans]SMC34710.1 diguanylate cyclase (GGDEF) domain-containing protein [Fulvimarina manganoxydans]